jgi:16S rRNA G527 N7-methylase RsmG
MKTLFLRKAVDELELKGVEIVCARMESMVEDASTAGPQYDAFTSRATLRLAPTLELAATFIRPGGTAFLWKGERLPEELGAPADWSLHWQQGDTIESQVTPTVIASFVRK